jgi:hypothetical protein
MSTLEQRITETIAHALELDIEESPSTEPMVWERVAPADQPALIAAALAPVIAEVQAEAWDKGYTVGNAHNGRRDANPYKESSDE